MSKLIEKVIKNCDDKDRVVKKELECAEQAYVEDKIEHILRNFKDDISDSKNIIKDLNRQLKDANKELKCMKNEYESFLDLSDKEVRKFILTENCSTTGPRATLNIRILRYLRQAELGRMIKPTLESSSKSVTGIDFGYSLDTQGDDTNAYMSRLKPIRPIYMSSYSDEVIKALEANPKYGEILRRNR